MPIKVKKTTIIVQPFDNRGKLYPKEEAIVYTVNVDNFFGQLDKIL